ncbi:hypothetical protein CAPTEDRAFT_185424 [Capitella teleta]|uniref:LRRCT domain-containing protein n=1 Tax=Capitella teleta TaxID=283909 RepID=R7UPT9_CAPTE|nr:hypothetical protein CAPTEDRAFT_185424 [Capitella teleta]|eukprot:ELU08098.1 hypothetical protein CAPTEDRAFT_185424 [Capitella teleta]
MSLSGGHVVQFILCLAITRGRHSASDFTAKKLKSLQETWPSYHEETSLDVGYNVITEIGATESDCANSPLESLDLRSNQISQIETDSFRTCNLTLLHLQFNQLTAFPDLWNIRDTLQNLRVNNNRIVSVGVSDISFLEQLVSLSMGENPITSFPDLISHLPAIQDFGITEIKFNCCRDYAWMKKTAHLTTRIDLKPCAYPAKWVARSLKSLEYDDLLQEPCRFKTKEL